MRVRYAADRAPALGGVDLDLAPGRRVALVGPSGSGKSTVLAVVAGTVVPEAGTVSLGGAPPDPETAWRYATGVMADAHVFHATVRENLTLGRPGIDDDAARAALRVAGLDHRHDALDRMVGEDGGQLSGGERQRLLLARALVAPTPVLLLDEATEGLDPGAAADVLGAALAAVPARRCCSPPTSWRSWPTRTRFWCSTTAGSSSGAPTVGCSPRRAGTPRSGLLRPPAPTGTTRPPRADRAMPGRSQATREVGTRGHRSVGGCVTLGACGSPTGTSSSTSTSRDWADGSSGRRG
ncbi:ATP-binding cassette domain-containing protein [Luedemannella flava]